MRRLIDILASFIGLLVLAPVLAVFCLLVWLQDFHGPFYIAPRVGRDGRSFRMVKLRSMVIGADKVGSSSGNDDRRITWIGRLIRKCKLDEFTQLWNVLRGDMSLVGPRPQVSWAVKEYTLVEQRLVTVRPGITDPASIVFADEGDILTGAVDADLLYSQIIRPWKNRMALLYVEHGGVGSYLWLIIATFISAVSRRTALDMVHHQLKRWGADKTVLEVARRHGPPPAAPPPGAVDVIGSINRT
ncbi:glycosyl transferase [Planctomycetota bacterium]|nr:glycosyl transferase [Planctomycetota bacterium]